MLNVNQGEYYYSPDGGTSWIGPFDGQQLNELRAAGIVQPSFDIRSGGGADEQAPPPFTPPTQQYWVIRGDGQQLGPYTVSDLVSLMSAGQIGPATLVYSPGMANPLPLSSLGILPFGIPGQPVTVPGGAGGAISQSSQGQENADQFSLGRFFSGVFKSHTQEEVVMEFCAGSPFGTPDIRSVNATWPSPWIFARVALFCAILYLGLSYMMSMYPNPKLIPAILFVANFGIPFCVLVLLYEINIRRDVPFYTVIKALMLGGVLSLFITSILNEHIKRGPEAYWAGPIEEPAKLLAAVFIASTCRNGRILTGMLIGCAVGAGFAAFESAGYAMDDFMRSYTQELWGASDKIKQAIRSGGLSQEQISAGLESVRVQLSNISVEPLKNLSLRRALLTPAGHVVWTAITAGAYWRVLALKVQQGVRAAEDRSVDFSAFFDMRFLCIAIVPVGLHMIWNSTIGFEQFGSYRYLILGIIAWFVLLRLAQMGINQVKEEKRKALQGQ